MSRRIDIELTSARPDGSWTWRAAGAREPKGVVAGSVLFEGAKSGDVVRAEADFEIDGITILSVLPPKEKKRSEPERIEILGSGRPDGPAVTTQLVGKGGRGGDRRRDGERPDRPERGDRGRREGAGPGAGGRPPRAGGRPGPSSGPASGRDADSRGRRPERSRDGAAADRPARPDGESTGAGPGRTPSGGRSQAGRPATPAARSKSRKLAAGTAHRSALLDELAPEERVVAEQVLRGGIPAVRTALHLEREKATAEGRPVPDTDALVTLAERLLPRVRTAEWRDRAEAVIKAPDEVGLRDLRSVVAGADNARDDETRALASTLREALEARLTKLRTSWVDEMRGHLAANRGIRAIRLSGRPPEPSTRLPADLADELAAHAGAAMAPDTSPDLWLAMLEAVAESPIRRAVKPVGLATSGGPDLERVARQQSGRVPGLAALLGIAIPPPPGPRRRLAEGGRPTPPPPPAPPIGSTSTVPAASEAAPVVEAAPASVAEPALAESVATDPTVAPEPDLAEAVPGPEAEPVGPDVDAAPSAEIPLPPAPAEVPVAEVPVAESPVAEGAAG